VSEGDPIPCTTPIYEEGITVYQSIGLQCPEPGLYQFAFQATLSSDDYDAGEHAMLVMRLFVDNDPTPWVGYRENWVRSEYGGQDWLSAENVAVSGLVKLNYADQVLKVVNDTQMTDFTAGSFQFWAMQVRS